MLDQVVAFIQEVMVGLEVSLAVELRYQCKAHNGIVPSAQPATSRSAAGTLEGKKSFPRPPAQSLQLKLPMRKWGHWAVSVIRVLMMATENKTIALYSTQSSTAEIYLNRSPKRNRKTRSDVTFLPVPSVPSLADRGILEAPEKSGCGIPFLLVYHNCT